MFFFFYIVKGFFIMMLILLVNKFSYKWTWINYHQCLKEKITWNMSRFSQVVSGTTWAFCWPLKCRTGSCLNRAPPRSTLKLGHRLWAHWSATWAFFFLLLLLLLLLPRGPFFFYWSNFWRLSPFFLLFFFYLFVLVVSNSTYLRPGVFNLMSSNRLDWVFIVFYWNRFMAMIAIWLIDLLIQLVAIWCQSTTTSLLSISAINSRQTVQLKNTKNSSVMRSLFSHLLINFLYSTSRIGATANFYKSAFLRLKNSVKSINFPPNYST